MNLETALAIMLRNKRKECGLSQERLALICNVDRTYISMLECKKRKPTLNTIFKICNTLNILPSDLLKEVEVLMNIRNNNYDIITIRNESKII